MANTTQILTKYYDNIPVIGNINYNVFLNEYRL